MDLENDFAKSKAQLRNLQGAHDEVLVCLEDAEEKLLVVVTKLQEAESSFQVGHDALSFYLKEEKKCVDELTEHFLDAKLCKTKVVHSMVEKEREWAEEALLKVVYMEAMHLEESYN